MADLRHDERRPLRIGAVQYLNARPLVWGLAERAGAEFIVDLPSRLADRLAGGDLDVALIPSIEYLLGENYCALSNGCVACCGPVRSVRLYGRVPVERVATLALDEGSRTSAALARILLATRHGVRPQVMPLPIGAAPEDCEADAVLVIGDRGFHAPPGPFAFSWDLGEEWFRWTGLPFVFALWVAQAKGAKALGGPRLAWLAGVLESARDEGLGRLEEIAHREAPRLGLSVAECRAYLESHLRFRLGQAEEQGLMHFHKLARAEGLAPEGVALVFHRTVA